MISDELLAQAASQAASQAAARALVVPPAAAPPPRHARVFLSSTFLDTHAERHLLVTRVLPALATWAAKTLELTVSFVDLRWGVPVGDSPHAHLICLREVVACAPLFVGVLTDRTGWCPPAALWSPDNPETAHIHTLVSELPTPSLTTLEVLTGALLRPIHEGARNSTALIYRRRWDRSDVPVADAERATAVCCDSPAAAPLQEALVDALARHLDPQNLFEYAPSYSHIRADGRVVVASLDVFADRVEADLKRVLAAVYGPTAPSAPSSSWWRKKSVADIWAADVALQAQIAARTGAFVTGRDAELAAIAEYLGAPPNGRVIVVQAASGAGKSTLLARTVLDARTRVDKPQKKSRLGSLLRRRRLDPRVACVFSNADSGHAAAAILLRTIKPGCAVPTSSESVAAALAANLHSGDIVVVDALDQLGAADGMSWLPDVPDVHVVLSVVQGTAAADAVDARFPPDRRVTLHLDPLAGEARVAVVEHFLGLRSKTLSAEQMETVVTKADAGIPIYLRVLVEEICVCGVYEELTQTIVDLPGTTPQLFQQLLSGIADDVSATPDFLSVIAGSRRGLREDDLCAVAGHPSGLWAAVHHRLRPYLGPSDAVVFCHRQLTEAAHRFCGDQAVADARHKIVEHLRATADGLRRAQEEPWLLAALGDTAGLLYTLGDFRVLSEFWTDPIRKTEVLAYLRSIASEEGGENALIAAATTESDVHTDHRQRRARAWITVLGDAGLVLASGAVSTHFEDTLAMSNKDIETAQLQHDRAVALFRTGDFEGAEELLQSALKIKAVAVGKRSHDYAATLGALGVVRSNMGDHEGALNLYMEDLSITKAALGPRSSETAITLNNIGLEYLELEDFPRAVDTFEEALEIQEAVLGPTHPEVGTILDGLGQSLHAVDRFADAHATLRRAVRIREAALGPRHPDVATTLSNWALVHFREGNDEAAIELSERSLEILTASLPPEHPKILRSRENLGVSLMSCEDPGHQQRGRSILLELGDVYAAQGNLAAVEEVRGVVAQMEEMMGQGG